MYHLDPTGRLVPTSRHLSVTAARRASQLEALRERRASGARRSRSPAWRVLGPLRLLLTELTT